MGIGIFYRLGELIYKLRWLVVAIWLLLLLSCIPFAPRLMDPFTSIGFLDPHSQSAKADKQIKNNIGYNYNQFIVMYHSNDLQATNPKFLQEIKNSLAGVKHFSKKHQIIYPDTKNKQISKDKHTAYAIVLFKDSKEDDQQLLNQIKSTIKDPPHLSMHIGGEPIFLDDTKTQTQSDLYKAEYFATPVALITMLIVFGSVVAASIPIIVGAISAFLILTTLFFLGHVFSLSVFTINIALLLGLCLSIDYALLIINRYRDELFHGRSNKEAIAITQATAGKAVFFSGLAVFISLSALLLFPINVLFSVGMGGLAAVCVAVLAAIILLPAILSILNYRINSLPIRPIRAAHYDEKTHWQWLVAKVVKRPLIYFILILCVLLFLGYPFLHAQYGISDFKILPKHLQSRQVFETFQSKFNENKLSPILVLVKSTNNKILTSKNIKYLYDYGTTIKKDPRVEEVTSIVNTEPRLTKEQYKAIYTGPTNYLNTDLKKLLETTTHKNLSVITITSKYPHNSPQTKSLINKLRTHTPDKLRVEIAGSSANTIDILNSISHTFLYALLWIVVFTYFILLILLRSLILPLKAIITTMLSLCASYGVLVFVFQDGNLHNLLNFAPQGILDISLLIIIFCALFGISMDYEVFLLTRIKEYYEQTGDNKQSIAFGIDRSSKIITCAAVIVILLCISFMSANVLIVKAFGLGIAVAVFVDAFLIRSILVPATMALLGKWNWYIPKWLDHILPKITFDPEK